MNIPLQQIIRRCSVLLTPVPTGVSPHVRRIADIKAVLFDIYGTLFISASGDVGTAEQSSEEAKIKEAMQATGIDIPPSEFELHQLYLTTIKQFHAAEHAAGNVNPEVNICDVWRRLLQTNAGTSSITYSAEQLEQLAVEYEVRANPVWPMPGCKEVLQSLQNDNYLMGIISNAQFYSPLLFPALLNSSIAECGFADDFQFFSYQHGCGKPGMLLYNLAVESLAQRNIAPHEVLYIGNDMLNDIYPAATVGFRTALFAGDARSLRYRADDERIAGIEPDIVVTHLEQLLECLG